MNSPQIAKTLHDARLKAKPVTQFTNENPSFSLEEAYRVQKGLLELALAEGDTLTGYKMGLTSKAKQRDVQVFDTIHGFLLKSSEISREGRVTTQNRIHPRVEPEIAVVFKEDFKGAITRENVLKALEGVYPAYEIVDSRYENFKFKLADVIADNTSASGYQIGKTNYLARLKDVPLLGVVVRMNGVIQETGAPAAVLGDPMLSVLSLLEHLQKEGTTLKRGMIILTGGITNSLPFKSGDEISVEWPGETLFLNAV